MWRHRQRESGFSLAELAIVLVIVTLLTGGLFVSLGTQQDISNAKETEKRLAEIREALIGFALANGRLPCPAAPPPAGGTESPQATGACTNALQSGYLPASLLGTAPADAQGYALDAWNNPIRYAIFPNVIAGTANAFSTPGTMKSLGIQTIALESVSPSPHARTFLFVCSSVTGISNSDCGSATKITDGAIAIVYSTGKNGTDETRGGADDIVFVSEQSPTADDLATWLSPNVLFNRMIAAGRLP